MATISKYKELDEIGFVGDPDRSLAQMRADAKQTSSFIKAHKAGKVVTVSATSGRFVQRKAQTVAVKVGNVKASSGLLVGKKLGAEKVLKSR